ncbi:MAG: GGDEF domain-containing protein [Sedimenticola sp.]
MDRNLEKITKIQDFLTSLNSDLNDFIRRTLEEDDMPDEEWSDLFDNQAIAHCWEYMKCDRNGCPMHSAQQIRCWVRVGTLCKGAVQGDFREKYRDCTHCDYYRMVHEDPARSLYENITVLVSHLSGEIEKFHRLSITDRLTGLFNREYFEEVIGKEIAKSDRYQAPISLMMIDIDGLKVINDLYGHLVGDAYIKAAGGSSSRIYAMRIMSSDLAGTNSWC